MDANSSSNCARRGFTLIELLVVVVIIGILAAMITAAAWKVMNMAKQTAYSAEMGKLSLALNQFKNTFGEYPPDFTNDAATASFLKRAFPYYDGDCPIDTQDPASALVFWLGGVSAQSGFPGFSKNPKDPFDRTTEARIGPFYEFKPERKEGDYYFAEQGKSETFAPYVYFKAEPGGGYGDKRWPVGDKADKWGTTRPHRNSDTTRGQWVQPNSFQIHCPGLDGKHGLGSDYPDGSDYEDADFDDQTDFSGGPLSAKMP